jgi:hypothetical protein
MQVWRVRADLCAACVLVATSTLVEQALPVAR